jgi:hypothetical protein
MKPFVNVDIEMPQEMLEALSIFEAYCIHNLSLIYQLAKRPDWIANIIRKYIIKDQYF